MVHYCTWHAYLSEPKQLLQSSILAWILFPKSRNIKRWSLDNTSSKFICVFFQTEVDLVVRRLVSDHDNTAEKMRKAFSFKDAQMIHQAAGAFLHCLAVMEKMAPAGSFHEAKGNLMNQFTQGFMDADLLHMLSETVPPSDIKCVSSFRPANFKTDMFGQIYEKSCEDRHVLQKDMFCRASMHQPVGHSSQSLSPQSRTRKTRRKQSWAETYAKLTWTPSLLRLKRTRRCSKNTWVIMVGRVKSMLLIWSTCVIGNSSSFLIQLQYSKVAFNFGKRHFYHISANSILSSWTRISGRAWSLLRSGSASIATWSRCPRRLTIPLQFLEVEGAVSKPFRRTDSHSLLTFWKQDFCFAFAI